MPQLLRFVLGSLLLIAGGILLGVLIIILQAGVL